MVQSPDPVPALKQQLANDLVARLDGWTQDDAERLIRFVARTKGTVTIDVAWTRHHLYLPRPRTPRPGATPGTTR